MEKNKAVALKYNQELPAPFIAARGKGFLAERMLAIAAEQGIPIEERADLTEVLFSLDAGTFIPEELYEVIAQLYVTIADVQEDV
ncbi:MAG: EscU/YscU/HrcU family type III secretion system export apparatus switch protein [Spirochaetia bacterium]